METYADIILPLPLSRLFTYIIPDTEISVISGKRVVVQFGKKKIYTGIVRKVHSIKPDYETKPIISVIDEFPIISELQFKFWQWISDYYMCSLGEIFKAALPSGLKLESTTNLVYGKDITDIDLNEKQYLLSELIKSEGMISISALQNKVDFNVLQTVKTLIEKKVIFASEYLQEKYKVKKQTYIRVADSLESDNELVKILDSLQKAPKQAELLMSLIYMSKYGTSGEEPLPAANEYLKSDILKHCDTTAAVIKALVTKGILISEDKEIGRLNKESGLVNKDKELNINQSKAYSEIVEQFENKDVVLLHGVTSSGKTEIFIRLIKEELQKGKQVLYLLPEIALTTQIIDRLKNIFGHDAGVYHSRFSDSERVEIWNNLRVENDLNKNYKIILGVRSSVFLPFDNLGLIIVDEEHENTYKQYNPAPRYNARDVSVVLAKLHGAKVLLGTATPSIETYYNAENGKYGLVELFSRYKDIEMPEIIVADVLQARKRKQMREHFTPTLIENIKLTIDNKLQVIIFQNRRGFSPFLECEACSWIPKCENCDVSLTYHKHNKQLTCHYCGYSYEKPDTCRACGTPALQTKGFGTEKIEEELEDLLPDLKIARMDLDSTRSGKAFRKIITDFQSGNTNVLIGTQMVTKGLDFDNVGLVGVMNADNLLNYPDFRAFERSFQLMAQVSGRAGRKNKRGKVIIQSTMPKHHIIQSVIENNFQLMYNAEMKERKIYKYPPFYRLISISVKHKKKFLLDEVAAYTASLVRNSFGNRLLGPEYPIISRIQNVYIKNMLLKIEKEKSPVEAKKILNQIIDKVKSEDKYKAAIFVLDVDPM